MSETPLSILERLRSRIEHDRYRQIYCNRDLNMQAVHWIGFDMDYTLAIYLREPLDRLTVELTKRRLVAFHGYPAALERIPFDPHFAIRGLVVDRQNGNILKLDAHRYTGRGLHGRRELTEEEREPYQTWPPNLSSPRFRLLDTLFEPPEAFIIAALIDLLEQGGTTPDYERIVDDVRSAIDTVHGDGSLKQPILENLGAYIERDAELAPALHRLRSAGKRLFLMTNSWPAYTHGVMSWLLGGEHPNYADWTAYFDVIITGARKPDFFRGKTPFQRTDPTEADLGPVEGRLQRGQMYLHGNLADFERSIGLGADQILYIGDHIYGDILRSKRDSAWRTCMVVPELEDEIRTARSQRELMQRWQDMEDELLRMGEAISLEFDLLERLTAARESPGTPPETLAEIDDALRQIQRNSERAQRRRRDLIQDARRHEKQIDAQFHPFWGPLFKQGNENSIFGEQVAAHACLYTSRASNFLYYSPTHCYRAPRDLMPHELTLRT